jgi:antiviral helicase SKI2
LQNFVRGKGNYAPFLPGGLEPEVALQKEEEEVEEEEEDGWKTRAPGFKRGVKLSGGESLADPLADAEDAADEFLAEMLGSASISSKAKRRRRDGEASPTLEISRLGDEDDVDGERRPNGMSLPGKKNVDDLLPIGVSFAGRGRGTKS